MIKIVISQFIYGIHISDELSTFQYSNSPDYIRIVVWSNTTVNKIVY